MTKVDEPAARQATPRPIRPRATGRLVANAVLALVFLWAAGTIDVNLARLIEAPAAVGRILVLMFSSPEWESFDLAAAAMTESVQIAWLGTLIGAALSLPLALLAARNVSSPAMSAATRQVLNALRTFPELILALIFVTIVGLGPLAGMLAIGLGSVGTLGKLGGEAIESIDTGPVEAARATGARRLAVMRWGVLPQALPEIVAFWLYRFEINIRASAILGIIGAGGIGQFLATAIDYRRWPRAGMAVLVVILATIAIDAVSGKIRRRIISGSSGRARSGRAAADLVVE